MSLSIDSARKPSGVRRKRKAAGEAAKSAAEASSAQLPVPAGPVRALPAGPANAAGETAIHAQVIGERRGLRAGPTIHDEARASYNRTEWSGAKDRRRPKGGAAKTQV